MQLRKHNIHLLPLHPKYPTSELDLPSSMTRRLKIQGVVGLNIEGTVTMSEVKQSRTRKKRVGHNGGVWVYPLDFGYIDLLS